MAITLNDAENNCKQGIRNLSGRVDLALGILCVSEILNQFSAILILVIILILILIINLILINAIINMFPILPLFLLTRDWTDSWDEDTWMEVIFGV